MRYRSQSVAYWYFAVALLLFALQLAFGFLSAVKYLGPDPLRAVLPFDVSKTLHTNLLVVWLIAGFLGSAFYVVPEESEVELHSPRLAYWTLALLTVTGVAAVVGYLFGWTAGNKLLEQPLPIKVSLVVVMLLFAYNIVRTLARGARITATAGILVAGIFGAALLYLPSLLEFTNYTIATFYRWWTIHLWVEGVFELIQGGLLAFLLLRLTGIDRDTVEKWLYIVVGLTFATGLIGTAHHYFWIGVPEYWLPLGGFFSALEPLPFLGMAIMAYTALRRIEEPPANRVALHWALGSAMVALIGAGILGLAHTWPAVNRWTHGTLITPMHGHLAFFGAYAMIVLGVITYSLPFLTGNPDAEERRGGLGLWSFWLQVGGMTGMTMAFAAAGVAQVYMERILGFGYLETQGKIQVHIQMLLAMSLVFTTGVLLFLWDFFVRHPRRGIHLREPTAEPGPTETAPL
ncbi:MAG: nitric-oxide reductase large subunit [Gemmatimonadetes bacterium]|nr:nitric-oxide reductase large subunit [Gemmatimonadota bacterium]NIQ52022.1 nitric-oxide reductase large subunit [Gemmatimonadota bacterium]NIU72122.1 nitric-oxide reductase large subunit [Gammaproteobacteria bacterium]NIX42683.1 nitric-oxide reductase large subunit [Gemmatimonadota bacterium]NIY06844.1 nitric-oxide reductase large subunit [Gemmatimonadota bacterium]